jgi:peptidoglycan-associated lipoprotein
MKNRVWMNIVMAILVAGLFFTVSCAKKTIVSGESTIENQADSKNTTQKDADEDTDKIAQQKLDDQLANAEALKQAKIEAAEKRFVNQDVHFEYDSSELSSMAKTILKEKAAWLKANSSASVIIEGHCDERGTTEYNLALGESRSSTVKAYLVNLGVASSRLDTISYGEEQPKDGSQTESAYRQNRRAHFAFK